MAKDYYLILGVAPDAGQEQIKSAYRRLVKTLHPDHHGADTRPFLDLQEAYSVLGNPRQRRRYDDRLLEGRRRTTVPKGRTEPLIPEGPGAEPLTPVGRPANLGDISLSRSFRTYAPTFDELFDFLWSNFGNLEQPKAERLRTLGVELTLTPQEARRGGQARITVPARALCPTCRGSGGVGHYNCWRCAGEGAISGELPVSLSFPPGIPDGYSVDVSLGRLGIRNCYLTVVFRVSAEAELVR